jgi:hypothetical protein
MAATQYIREASNPVFPPIATATLVNIGDFCALDGNGEVIPAEAFTWNTDLATTQTDFADAFLGHAFQYKPADVASVYGNGQPNIIGVSTSGIYAADLQSATTLKVGDLVGLAKNPSANELLPQTVVKVDAVAKAIGVVVQAGVDLTRCDFRLLPTVVPFAR